MTDYSYYMLSEQGSWSLFSCCSVSTFMFSSPPLQFFHFSSRAFPPNDGQFTGRIRWQGSPARGEASISLINATLNDNGTYTCSVRNPPDVHGSPTSHTVLTVTPKRKITHTRLSWFHLRCPAFPTINTTLCICRDRAERKKFPLPASDFL